jgi:hypothetical protein
MNKQITGQKAKQGQNGKSGSSQNQSPNKRVTRQSQKMARRQEEQQKREAALRRAKQRRLFTIISLVAVVVLAIGLTTYFIATAHSQQNGQQGSLNIQETPVNPSYPAVDGIYCDTLEQTAYHVHAHVSIWINGQLAAIPAGVGIAPDTSCYYWLHTHNPDGIIHIEAPAKTTPTFGNFLDIWDSHFSSLGYPIQLADPTNWKVWVDGKPYTGNFRNIPLQAHELITLAYNSPNVKPDTTYAWNGL